MRLRARRDGRVETVALVGPPAVDAEIEHAACDAASSSRPAVVRPLAVGVRPLGIGARGARIVHRAGEVPALDDDVQHDLEVIACSSSIISFGSGKTFCVPGELAVVACSSPTGQKLGAEIDQRVARQLLLAKRACASGMNLVAARERAVRLLIAERPQRRHLRAAR